ncbi:MAG: putative ribosomal methyltransferase [Ilumatobacteraceae bacterium]|nr:putative ribosomal methyltransferase [Ilumatobacteraceae bacterium]
MRVISGEFGGRKLIAPDGLSTRPTTDKVRQAMFNSLNSMGVLEDATVVDLYAGSGALGIEALSRGAASCVFVERDRAALAALRENLSVLGLEDRSRVVSSDVLAYAAGVSGVDIALIDPPYTFTHWPELLAVLRAGLVVAESDTEVAAPPGWEQLKSKRHGRTVITTLERLP